MRTEGARPRCGPALSGPTVPLCPSPAAGSHLHALPAQGRQRPLRGDRSRATPSCRHPPQGRPRPALPSHPLPGDAELGRGGWTCPAQAACSLSGSHHLWGQQCSESGTAGEVRGSHSLECSCHPGCGRDAVHGSHTAAGGQRAREGAGPCQLWGQHPRAGGLPAPSDYRHGSGTQDTQEIRDSLSWEVGGSPIRRPRVEVTSVGP